MEWGVLFVVVLGVSLGFIVLQATFAARHWRRVIGQGDVGALREALDEAFDHWRSRRPPRGFPPADWQALQSAALVAADRDRCRVSLLAGVDVRVVGHRHEQVGGEIDVGRRVAVMMVERLLYEIPHVRFDAVQVDVYAQYRDRDGIPRQQCLLTTQVTRALAQVSDWDVATPAEMIEEWDTREAAPGQPLEPDEGALIASDQPGAVLSLNGAYS